jgi:hypothetical protein
VALSAVKKFVICSTLLIGAAAAGVGSVGYMATRPVELDLQQDPNKVELQEADRKLQLFNEAAENKKKGFIRLSEVEINSFLENRHKMVTGTNATSSVELVKTAILLNGNSINVVTYFFKPVFGYRLPFVWQRLVSPKKETNGWAFNLQQMKLGTLEIPPRYWPKIEEFVGPIDSAFEDRMAWLSQIPTISITHNEVSKAPEVRLYTFVPDQKNR